MIKHDNFGAKSLDFKPNKHKRKPYVGSHVMLVIILLFVLVPFYILLITSLESEIEANNAAFSWWPKMGLTVEAYKAVLFRKMGGTSVVRGLWNTLWIYVPGLIVGLFMSAMSAFSFAKLRFRGKNFMFSILMATMMIPNCMSTIASFLVFDNIGWVNTPFPLMIPRMFGAIGVVFFLRQYFMGIPDDLVGAARIDGLGSLGIFVKIMIGVAAPALIAQFILTFIGAYNDYMAGVLRRSLRSGLAAENGGVRGSYASAHHSVLYFSALYLKRHRDFVRVKRLKIAGKQNGISKLFLKKPKGGK